MALKQATYIKSRQEILSRIVNFCTYNFYGNGNFGKPIDSNYSFRSSFNGLPPIGSLCKLTSTRDSKWCLAWLVEIVGDKFLLKNIEDGELCWWENIGLDYLPIQLTDENPQWKWDDDQWDFQNP